MNAEKQIQCLDSVKKLLKKTKKFQEQNNKEVLPRIHGRKGSKRDVGLYILCKPRENPDSIEICMSGRELDFAHAVFFKNEFGNPQILEKDSSLNSKDEFDRFIIEALEILSSKEFTDDDDGYYNPYLDGYYISRQNPGKDGLANMQRALGEGAISQEFIEIMKAWKFTISERHPDEAGIERLRLRREAKKKKKLGLSLV